MSDYEIGYGRPPMHSRYRTGKSGNPTGRPKRQLSDIAKCVKGVLEAPMQFTEGGKKKTASREEVNLRLIVARAVTGDLKAAEQLLHIYAQAQRRGGRGAQRIVIEDWLPDFAGQTAEQKTIEMFGNGPSDQAAPR